VLLAALSSCIAAAESPYHWTVAQNSHFEVYSQTGDATAQKALLWFEQLRTFFQQNGLLGASLGDQGRPVLRVIGFRSEKDYEEYRFRPAADAYYVSDGRGDYIVMAALQAKEFGTAAHEYVHYVLHARGLKLPAWLSEGLAEFFSTLRLSEGGYELGGDLAAHTQALRRNTWFPLAELLDFTNGSPMPNARKGLKIFYAESWALADMLITSPQYAAHFRELIAEFSAGSNAMQAFQKIYKKSLDEVAKSLEDWVARPRSPGFWPSRTANLAEAHSSELSARQTSTLLAQLSLVSGHLEQARTQYEELLQDETDNPDFRAALGTIALRQGNQEEALKQWRQALSNGVTDAELCYRYALLAEEAGWDAQDVKAALERAVALAPGFDDARYKLALIQNQAGHYRSAVEQLRAMRVPVGGRRYAYWIAIASALIELNEREQAKEAAEEAAKAAHTDADRLQARQMAIVAVTDLTVRFATDSEGHSQLVTARVRRGTTDWNPFIEPSDRIQRASGKLSEVLCTADKLTGFLLRTSDGPVTVEVPDPSHVLMRNSPNEFYCGRMPEKAVAAEYAIVKSAGKTTNVLRGMTFQ
jgi:tetratricopeptide (TPR) repeat protein